MNSNNEPKVSQLIHVIAPTFVIVILSSISLYFDINYDTGHF